MSPTWSRLPRRTPTRRVCSGLCEKTSKACGGSIGILTKDYTLALTEILRKYEFHRRFKDQWNLNFMKRCFIAKLNPARSISSLFKEIKKKLPGAETARRA
jgi:hypothetical protein